MALTEPSYVAAIPAADPAVARAHFAARLAFETDCADVHAALSSGKDLERLTLVQSQFLVLILHGAEFNLEYGAIESA